MKTLTASKQKMLIAIIDFKDKCATLGQNGLITTGISETLKETLSNEQIDILIKQLQRK